MKLAFGFEILVAKIWCEKRAQKTLMKLTPPLLLPYGYKMIFYLL